MEEVDFKFVLEEGPPLIQPEWKRKVWQREQDVEVETDQHRTDGKVWGTHTFSSSVDLSITKSDLTCA